MTKYPLYFLKILLRNKMLGVQIKKILNLMHPFKKTTFLKPHQTFTQTKWIEFYAF